eukprot:TRINITY_DN1515_c0_g1_i2.p1 TRINITY_DN1515_c0_g1~~TRINITY_DN1515_c0_g1_i2.p1  ORF type:complete len:293 (-),score=57.01 TRINITY_DN1515_c0_g1_i2:151-1029(-)
MQQKKIKNQGWEQSEFPILCETCLGDNPYIRMLKTPYGKECKICQRPFTKFRWKAGTKGRYKETIVCQACAKIKNVCQTCLFDLDYGLPVEVRDKFLEDKKIVLPTSEKSRDYWIEQANSNIDQLNLPYESLKSNEILDKLKKSSFNLKRNEPHYCTFFAKGMCNRGDECPYLHQIKEKEEPADKNIKARFHGNNDPLAKKILSHIINEKQIPQTNKPSGIQNENLHPEDDDEGLLIPGKGFQKMPAPPLLPPPEFQKTQKASNCFVEKLLMKTAQYPSMNSHALGLSLIHI